MRKVVVSNIVSLDGRFTGRGGDVMAMPFAEGFSEYNAERLRAADTLLLGRSSYVGFRDYWPQVADDESQPELEREISRLNGAIEKIVVSDSLTEDQTGAWAATTRIVPRADLAEEVSALRAGDGGDILVFGSHVLWNALLAQGLVDELHLMVGPGVVPDGEPAFTGPVPGQLQLLSAAPLGTGGLALLRYAVRPVGDRSPGPEAVPD